MLKFIPSGIRRVLDIGCGEGNFGEMVKEQLGAEVWGIELCLNVALKAGEKLDKILVFDIESEMTSIPACYFDCIVFNDVLEHLKYPWTVLHELRKNLVNYGYVVASIPNVRYYHHVKELLLHSDWEYRAEGILDKTHLRFFTEKTIRSMFVRCGYRVLTIEGISATASRKFHLMNALFFNKLEDMKYLQFACVAQKM
jgi:2-polyprenyl-3-methyl-5-hydroxy-6-metoxy-1,4-benzoquinol methylase